MEQGHGGSPSRAPWQSLGGFRLARGQRLRRAGVVGGEGLGPGAVGRTQGVGLEELGPAVEAFEEGPGRGQGFVSHRCVHGAVSPNRATSLELP